MEKGSEGHYPLVLVTWRDATSFGGWHSIKGIEKLKPEEITSVGFQIRTTPEFIVLATGLQYCEEHEGTDVMDIMFIPRDWTMRVEELGLVAGCKCEEKTLCKYEENCGFCEVQVKQEKAEDYAKPLEAKPGDDYLNHQLTLDEHLRRGGKFKNWNEEGINYDA